ncbi:MAG: transketolase [Rhodospirillaceae bacterium]|nr:transketolase [Rhodospirillaceae bacterium]
MANAIRALAMDAVERAKSGHPGMPLGMADVATVLFSRHLTFDPKHPTWPDRDRFVLSGGHGSMLLYSLLHLTGYEGFTIDQIRQFRQFGALAAGHPECDPHNGIETTTGPLGQGLGNAVGMALAERVLNARFGDALVNHSTYVMAGDGDLMEGISHEAASLAGHLKLHKLIVLYDDNGISIDGPTSLSTSDDVPGRFRSMGWDVQRVDGHDMAAVDAAIAAARLTDTPSLICCRTVIGFGAPTKAGTEGAHGAPLGAEEIEGVRQAIGWPHPPFEIPDAILRQWRSIGAAGQTERLAWESRLAAAEPERRDAFQAALDGRLPADLGRLIAHYKREAAAEQPKLATRQASGEVLAALLPAIPAMIGGSADLTGSNSAKPKGAAKVVAPGDYGGQFVHYGVREHAMAAAMNGLALHGGCIPYGGTFLIFADYCRPSIRLSSMMRQRVIYVMTHDSIGLGEDGPTHQPVEQLATLRAVPGLAVMRPADAVETAECWEIALRQADTPTVLALTRQSLPIHRVTHTDENLSARGAYVLADSPGARVTLLATGSEVSIAMAARELLEGEDIAVRVVSMPCWPLFDAQPRAYRESVIDPDCLLVAVEAGIRQGWDHYIGREGIFIGMSSFGISAPYPVLYKHFGITPNAIADTVKLRFK